MGRVREGLDAGQQITESAPSARLKFTNGANAMKKSLISLGVLWGGASSRRDYTPPWDLKRGLRDSLDAAAAVAAAAIVAAA